MCGPPRLSTCPKTIAISGPLRVFVYSFGYVSVCENVSGRRIVLSICTSILGTLFVEKQGPLYAVKCGCCASLLRFLIVSLLNSICFSPWSIMSYAPNWNVNLGTTTFLVCSVLSSTSLGSGVAFGIYAYVV